MHSRNVLQVLVAVSALLSVLPFGFTETIAAAPSLPAPPEVWKDYDPDVGDFKEEIVAERTEAGIYYRESYISAYVNNGEIRVFCKYAVKEGAKNAPGLMDVHGWMGRPNPDKGYVNDGWAVMSHDYSGISTNRPQHTSYPAGFGHGRMDARQKGFKLIYDRMPDGSQTTNPKATSHYLWNAIQRRVLSYLLAQKEVDANRIGAKGYSYGGTIMWNLAMDARVKAVVAYFGIGWINYYRDRRVWKHSLPQLEPKKMPGHELYLSAIAPQAHAPHITAASLWLNGSNDHHGGHERGCDTFKAFNAGVPWDFAIQARGHHNTEKLGSNCKLWLERHVLKKKHFWPARPKSTMKLGADGVVEVHMTPASPDRIKELQVYKCLKTANNTGRVWSDVKSVRNGNTWVAKLPVFNIDEYLFSYANIRYDNDCVISSDFEAVVPSSLGKAMATAKTSDIISEGTGQWHNVGPAEGVGGIKGFRPLNNHRGTHSKQFGDREWQAPSGAELAFKFYCTQPQRLQFAVNEHWVAEIDITASNDWQTMTIPAAQMKKAANQQAFKDWSLATVISIKPVKGADITKVIFADFSWKSPGVSASPTGNPSTKGKRYLTAAMASKTDTFWRVMEDASIEGKKAISIGGKTYARGLGVHAPSRITFPLNGAFASFHVVPGPDDAHKGLIEMKVLVDGKEAFASGNVRSPGYRAKAVKIDVSGAKKLTLVVTDAGDGKGGDHASWAEAYLTPIK